MARTRGGDGRKTTDPPKRFEVDLTSVCVRTGAVQLPFRLQGAFAEGPVPAADADGSAELELRFLPPRRLTGLRPFFERHDLRSNDRIALLFGDAGLHIEAVRRERAPRPSARAADPRSAATPAAGATAQAAAPSTATTRPTTDAPVADHARGGPIEQRVAHPRRAGPPPSVRAAQVAVDQQDHEDAPPRRAEVRWEPLDVTAPPGGWPQGPQTEANAAASEESSGRVVVREVRRVAASPSAPAGRPVAEPRATPVPSSVPEQPVARDVAPVGEPAVGTPQAQGRGLDLFGLRRRFGFGRPSETRRTAAPAAAPTPSDADVVAVPVSVGAEAVPVPVRTGAVRPSPASPVESGGPPSAGAPPTPRVEPAVPVGPRRSPAPRPEAAGRTLPVAETPAASPEPAVPAVASSQGEDLGRVDAYLHLPDTPAIVRSDAVAEALGLTQARVDRALDRLAEDRERVTRIRPGAYMVRRKPPREG